MMPRFQAFDMISKRQPLTTEETTQPPSQQFGSQVFSRLIMQKVLPKEIYDNVCKAMEGKERIKEEYANPIAVAMKDWAISLGATHYTHWFQPLTGASAEKHDAFIDWLSPDQMIDKFSGKQLIQGEPDASSFPSGGLRSTYEARGYTGWDPASPVFIWKEGNGTTLCIPSVFFSWTGAVLDTKIPLHRSEKKLSEAALRLLRLTGIKASLVYTTIGLEQEYFVIDRALRNLRPDLLLAGRTVFGAPSPKGQELQDHYFGSVKERILCFMQDFEGAALKLGIPVKTRHNEVAPAQHEVAPIVESATRAIDHNIQLMELMRKIAVNHDLVCLLHEKPFHGINGSGKHCNWSLATDTGINLLDPTENPENNLHFLILLTAVLHAVHKNAGLLRASIGSASNDNRLGGHEAPPAIMSIYLGEALESLLNHFEEKGLHPASSKKGKYDLGILHLPGLTKDNTDRNRTSPFAFTGNKFEFRAVGSSANAALPVTVLNAAVADSLNHMLDEIEGNLKAHESHAKEALIEAMTPVVRKYLKASKPIRFSGDNYSSEWKAEAKRRKLPNIAKSIEAFSELVSPQTKAIFEGILTPQELQSRYEIMADIYAQSLSIETNLMIDLFRTQILPASLKQQEAFANSVMAFEKAMGRSKGVKGQKALLSNLTRLIEEGITQCSELEKLQQSALKLETVKKAHAFADKVLPAAEKLREIVDSIENNADDSLWPLPKYRELLFMI